MADRGCTKVDLVVHLVERGALEATSPSERLPIDSLMTTGLSSWMVCAIAKANAERQAQRRRWANSLASRRQLNSPPGLPSDCVASALVSVRVFGPRERLAVVQSGQFRFCETRIHPVWRTSPPCCLLALSKARLFASRVYSQSSAKDRTPAGLIDF